jgi:hypothetical protein
MRPFGTLSCANRNQPAIPIRSTRQPVGPRKAP